MKKRESSKPATAADVLQRVFENSKSPLADGFQRYKLEGKWSSIVGPTIGKHSRPIGYDRGRLVIEVTNSVWLNEIRFLLDEIKVKVNTHLGHDWVDYIQLIHK
jgi:predicted nucleic acid-binding Zn ribbon protein